MCYRTLTALLKPSNCSMASTWRTRSTLYEAGIGARENSARQNLPSTFKTDLRLRSLTPRSQIPTLLGRTRWRSNFRYRQTAMRQAQTGTLEEQEVEGERPVRQRTNWWRCAFTFPGRSLRRRRMRMVRTRALMVRTLRNKMLPASSTTH